MATYVLVSGAWSGGWHWKQVARYLRAAGHEVYTPTLTGLGERKHLLTRDVGLDTHITDVVNVLEYEDLHDVILVGWSHSGMVVTAVAEQVPERLAHIVYLDAYVPEDGESVADIVGSDLTGYFEQVAREQGDGWRVPHAPPDAPYRTDHPLKTIYDRVTVRNPTAADLPRTYIHCTVDNGTGLTPIFRRTGERARAKGWRYRELPANHLAPETMPRELADLLLEVAELSEQPGPGRTKPTVGSPLVGTWRLVSLEFRSEDGDVSYPLGQDALGYLIYTADGYMSASLMAANRTRFYSMDTRLATLEEKAAAEDTYVTYCGRYTLEDDRVIHHLELSLLPNWTGTDQVRFYKLEGDELTISTLPMFQAGRMQSSHLIWRRA